MVQAEVVQEPAGPKTPPRRTSTISDDFAKEVKKMLSDIKNTGEVLQSAVSDLPQHDEVQEVKTLVNYALEKILELRTQVLQPSQGGVAVDVANEHNILTTNLLIDLVKDKESLTNFWYRMKAGGVPVERIKALLKNCYHLNRNDIEALDEE